MKLFAFGLVILGVGTYVEAIRLVNAPLPIKDIIESLQTVEDGNIFANFWQKLKLKVQNAYESIYDPRFYWAKWLPYNTKNPWTLYNVLKGKPDCFVDLQDVQVEEEELKSSDDAKKLLHKYGYLKAERPDVPYPLYSADNNFEFALYADLVSAAQWEDKFVGEVIWEIKSTFQRMPPKVDDFKSLILALDTLLHRIPRIFKKKWEVATMVGALYASGLDNFTVTTGPTANYEFLSCEGLPGNTRLQMLVHFSDYATTQDTWSIFYEPSRLPEMIIGQEKILRIAILIDRYWDNNAAIRDWHAEYQFSEKLVLYKP